MAKTFFKLVVHTVAQRCWSMSYHTTCLPDAAFGALAATARPAKKCMAYLRKVYEAVWAAEQLVGGASWQPPRAAQADQADAADPADENPPAAPPAAPIATLQSCLDDVAWNSLHVCREVLAADRESSWDYREERLRTFLWDLSATESNTKRVNEDIAKIIRDAKGENPNERVSPKRLHYLARGPACACQEERC